MLYFILCHPPYRPMVRKLVFSFAFLMITLQNGFADTRIWTGSAGDGLWSSAANWNGNAVPASSDDVLLDNSIMAADYQIILPNSAVTVKTLTINAGTGKIIQLILPSSNTAEPAFTATGPGYGLVLNNGGIFQNASGLASGESMSIADSILINNGGRYIHRTRASHANNIVRLLSTAPGTEKGIFEFDVPRASYTVSISNRRYGTLVFSALAMGAAVTYTGSGSNPLTINGNLEINAGVNLKIDLAGANGNVSLKGDYIQNGGVFDIASGAGNSTVVGIGGNLTQLAGEITESNTGLPSIELNGTSSQTISLAGGITNSINFRIDNPLGVVLASPLSLPYKLELMQGKINTSAINLLTLQFACSVSADSTATDTYIDGPLRKEGLAGAPLFLFPVGKNRQRWLELKNATGNFTVEFMNTDPRSLSNDYGTGIDHISALEYWQINADARPSASANIELSFAVPESGEITDLMSLTVGSLSGSTWTDAGHTGITGTFNTAGSVISEAVNVFNNPAYFTLASNSSTENPLPVKLVYFNGAVINRQAILNWQIDFPDDADYFEVLTAGSSMNFTTIGRLPAKADQFQYRFTDASAHNGLRYYRLLVTEKNGNTYLSKTINLNYDKEQYFRARMAPSVLYGSAALEIISPGSAQLQWQIISTDGRIVKTGSAPIGPGTNTISLELSGLAAGSYQLSGFDGQKRCFALHFIKI